MKLISLIIFAALGAGAGEINFVNNEHFPKYKIVENLQTNKNDFEAIQKLKNLFDVDKQNEIYVLDKLSKIYADHKLTDRYIQFLNSKITESPFAVNLNQQLAKEYLATQKPAQACEKAKFMLPHVAQKTNLYTVLTDCSIATNKLDEAISYLDKLIIEKPDATLNMKRAELYLKVNNLTMAKADLDYYSLKAKRNEPFYLLQSELHTKLQQPEKLPDLYKQCLDTVGVSPQCFLGYLTATKTLNAAFKVEHFNKYMTEYQNHTPVLIEIGRHYQQIKNYPQAEHLFTLAHGKNPDNIEPVTMLFSLYYEMNQSQKAFEILSRFMKNSHNPTDIQTAQNLKNTLYQKGQSEMNANQLKPTNQAVVTQPDTTQQLYVTKKYSEILSRIKKNKVKSDADYYLAGNIYYLQNNYNRAIANWQEVKTSSPLYHKAVFNTVVLMRTENRISAADNLFNAAEFPLQMQEKTIRFTELRGQFPKRLPAGEQKAVDDLFKALLYLDWEP